MGRPDGTCQDVVTSAATPTQPSTYTKYKSTVRMLSGNLSHSKLWRTNRSLDDSCTLLRFLGDPPTNVTSAGVKGQVALFAAFASWRPLGGAMLGTCHHLCRLGQRLPKLFKTLPLLVFVTELVSGEVLSRDQPGDYPGFSEGNQCQMRKKGYPMSSHAQIEAREL